MAKSPPIAPEPQPRDPTGSHSYASVTGQILQFEAEAGPLPGARSVLEPGTKLGRYEVLFPLAAGGMAEVFAGRIVGEGGFQKAVAVKAMLPHLSRDERFVDMFLDEGRIASNIRSPHVVETVDLGREGDTLYLVMELVVGVTLRELQKEAAAQEARVPLPAAIALAAQAAAGLHDAHTATLPTGERLEIVHRDVSPHNVLVGVDGRARLSDFGVAHAVERLSRTLTGELKGKVSYFAPEQVAQSDIDQRADVFALAVITWELCSGQRLFDGDNLLQIAQQVSRKEIPRLDTVADVPPAVADVVAKALERDRDRRTPNAETFRRELVQAGQATVGLASSQEIGQLVVRLAKKRVEDVQTTLRTAMREGPRVAAPSPLPPPGERSSSSDRPTTVGSMVGAERVAARSRSRTIGIALLMAVAVAGGVAAALLGRGGGEPAPVAAEPTAATVEEAMAPTPDPSTEATTEEATEAPTETAAVAPEPAPAEAAEGGEADTEAAEGPSASERRRARLRARRARRAAQEEREEPARTATPEPAPAPVAERPRQRPPETQEPEPAPQPSPTPPRLLKGLDAFDQDLSRGD